MKSIRKKIGLITFFASLVFFIYNWSYILSPFHRAYGTTANAVVTFLLILIWSLCNKFSIETFLNIKTKYKIIYATSLLALIPISIRLNSILYTYGDTLRDITNWHLNIYYFDQGMFFIFSILGILCTSFALVGYFIKKVTKS